MLTTSSTQHTVQHFQQCHTQRLRHHREAALPHRDTRSLRLSMVLFTQTDSGRPSAEAKPVSSKGIFRPWVNLVRLSDFTTPHTYAHALEEGMTTTSF